MIPGLVLKRSIFLGLWILRGKNKVCSVNPKNNKIINKKHEYLVCCVELVPHLFMGHSLFRL